MMNCTTFDAVVDSVLVGDATRQALAEADRHARECAVCRSVWPLVRQTVDALEAVSARTAAGVNRDTLDASRARLRAAFTRAQYPPVRFSSVRSPAGHVYFGMTDRGVCDVTFGMRRDGEYRRRLGRRVPEVWRDDKGLRDVRDEFLAYFEGRSRKVAVRTDLRGVTPFVGQVLRRAKAIPFGHVTSYGALAHALGRPQASRAVGGALGRNPVPIVIPCHRVVRATGQLGGYVGGTRAKQTLLALEGYRAG